MPGMRRTTVWLRDQEIASLRMTSKRTRRTQSDLIREGIFMITRQFGAGASEVQDEQHEGRRRIRFSRQEGTCMVLRGAGYSVAGMARELRISEAEVDAMLTIIDQKMDDLIRRGGELMRATDP